MSNKKQRILQNIMLLLIIYFLLYSIINGITHDNYFIAATGKYILENGIPYTNPFTINEGLPFVCQQWLFCVIYYLADCIPMGANIFTMLGITLMIWLSMKLTKSDLDTKSHLLIIMLSLCIVYSPLVTHRPEWVTVVLLLTQMIIQEKSKDNPKLLYFLPLIAVAEINLHASMWIMHACLLVPYFLPFGKLKPVLKVTKHAVIATILSAAALFLNPYGWDNIIYLYTSTQRMHQYGIKVYEMQSPILHDIKTAAATISFDIIFIITLIANYKNKKFTSSDIYVCIGLLICSNISERNSMFLYIGIIICFVKFLDKNALLKIFKSKIYKEYKIIPIISTLMISVYMLFTSTISILCSIDPIKFKNLSNIITILAIHDTKNLYEYRSTADMLHKEDKNAKILTTIEYGSYLVYRDIYSVSCTCNIEQYLIDDKNEQIPIEYYYKFVNGTASNQEIDYYDIDYYILPSNRYTEKNICTELKSNRWKTDYDGQFILRTDLDLNEMIIFESKNHYNKRKLIL